MPTTYPAIIDTIPDAPPGNVPLGGSAPKHTKVHQKLADVVNALQAATMRKDRNWLNVKEYGAIGDGTTHPLSASSLANPGVGYTDLAAAQVDYPDATSLDDEIDWAAFQKCINFRRSGQNRGSEVLVPRGDYIINRPLVFSDVCNLYLHGEGVVWDVYAAVFSPVRSVGAARLHFTGTGFLLECHDLSGGDHVPFKGVRFSQLVFNVENRTAGNGIFTVDGGTGIFFQQCYFGGGDKQMQWTAGTPFDYYMSECYFGPSMGDIKPNYCAVVEADASFGGESTIFDKCTFRFTEKTHFRGIGQTAVKFNSCTMESTYDGPSIHVDSSLVSSVSCYNCHWEGIFQRAYWNGTHYQKSSGDSTRAAVIEVGAPGVNASTSLYMLQCEMNLRVIPGSESTYGLLLRGGTRASIMDLGLAGQLLRALVWKEDYVTQVSLTRVANTGNPNNGDMLVSGADDTRKSQRGVVVTDMPLSPSLWEGATTGDAQLGQWTAVLASSTRVLLDWRAGSAAPTYPLRGRRDWHMASPSDLGSATFQTDHKPFRRGDAATFDSFRTGSPSNLGYGTRYGVIWGKDDAVGNDATARFPLVTGPGISADLGNVDFFWTYGANETELVFATPLTTERRVTMTAWGYTIPNGARLRIVRDVAATGNYDLILTQPVDGVDTEMCRIWPGQWVEIMCNGGGSGAVWRVVGGGPTVHHGAIAYEFKRPLATLGRIAGVRTIVSSGGSTTLDETDHKVFITGTNTHTVVMPACRAGREIDIENQSTGAATAARAGSDTINGGTSLNIPAGQHAGLVGSSDTNWFSAIPGAHAPTHKAGGADELKLDELGEPTDNTDLDATTARHGLMSKIDKSKVDLLWGTPPHNSDSPGVTNSLATDGVYLYVCLTTDTWVRCPLSSWATTAPPLNTVAPEITGTLEFTETITCGIGVWSGDGTFVYTYAWYVDGVLDASLGTDDHIEVTTDYAEALVKCEVTATSEYGADSVFSNEVTFPAIEIPVNTVAPELTGTPWFGQTLTSSPGTWTGTFPTLTYEWYVDNVLDAGLGTAATCAPGEAYAGKAIKCKVTGTNSAGSDYEYSNAITMAWSPKLLANLLAWFDADDSSTLTLVSGKISQWNDKSANGYNLTQGTDGLRPTSTANGLNGRAVSTWDGVREMETAASIAHSGDFSSGVVAKCTYTNNCLFQIGGTNDAGSLFTSSPNWHARPRAGGSATIGWTTNVIALLTHTTIASTGKTNIWKDGTKGTEASASSVAASGKVLHVGGINSTTYRMTGVVAEMVICAQTLSDTDREKLEGYLAYKWGQQGNLPEAHPYKASFP